MEQTFAELSSLLGRHFLFFLSLVFLPSYRSKSNLSSSNIHLGNSRKKGQVSHNVSYTPETGNGENYVAYFKKLEVLSVTSDRTIGNVLKLQQERFRVYIRKNIFPKRTVNLWNSLPRDVIHPFL